jgi:hypothetical protein
MKPILPAEEATSWHLQLRISVARRSAHPFHEYGVSSMFDVLGDRNWIAILLGSVLLGLC